ncbi:MAG: DNA-directed RNA polymerase subunit alpha [Victivallaceae bacterium]|nr:DNA-directed RNA polymerase subunit alpha [Victivallaceae bacterium]
MAAVSAFPMPQAIVMDEASATNCYAKFTAAPFLSGFGHTIGNSLRRVLLSSLEGAAICATRIDGVEQEFSSLPGILEDVTEIILNLKNIQLNLYDTTSTTLEIRKDKAGPVTAGDIVTDGTVEILNPDFVICTLDKATPFRAEIDIISGRGYTPAEKHGHDSQAIGTIPVDSLFSPVTRVNYHVGAARVGEETEMDSLEIEIWTDGRVTPEDALISAANILKDHLMPFLGGEAEEEDVLATMTDEELKMYKVLIQDVEVIDLSVRAMNCLNNADIKIIGELCSKTESRMLKYRNFGKKSLDEIKEKIEGLNLALGMSFSEKLTTALEAESERLRVKEGEEE